MWMKAPALLAAALIVIAVLTAVFYHLVMDIERDFSPSSRLAVVDSTTLAKPVVYVGVISRYRPRVIYRGYQPIMDYLTVSTPYRFELRLSKDYNAALQNLISQRVSAVFLGSYLYVHAHTRHGVLPILKPLNENLLPVSRSVLIANPRAGIKVPRDLFGKKLALPAKASFSSHWIIDYELGRHGIKPDDLAAIHNLSHHHTVIAQVLNGRFDAGVTREYLVKDLLGKGLRAVLYSDPIPSSPIAVAANYDREIIGAMQAALLAVNRDEKRRREITQDWDGEFVNGFVTAADSDYAIVRTLAGAGAITLEEE